jgi:acetylornithine deacetylase/succinyl-diaminopimelate desuccinylase-like protein
MRRICISVLFALVTFASFSLHADERQAQQIFKELVDSNTAPSGGGDTSAAVAGLVKHLKAAGFSNNEITTVSLDEKRVNLVVRYTSANATERPLLMMAHLDVVEALPEDWSFDPFKMIERDGYFYGRGTVDNKAGAAIIVANLIRLKQEGFQPDRDIIVALTADEESIVVDYNGVRWLLENRPELIDAEYAINEGGGGAMRDGESISNNVQASEKVYQSFRLEVTNPGGHSSLPVKENAIYRLADALIRIRAHDFPVGLNDVTRNYFSRSSELEQGELAQAMKGVLLDPPDPSAIAFLSRTPQYNARLRTTCVATLLEGGHADNALPQRAQATINCRILPSDNPQAILETLITVVGDPQVNIKSIYPAIASPSSPLTPEVLGSIEAVSEEMWPGVPVMATMSTGATDGLYLRNAGIPVYGVSGIFHETSDNRSHGQNERMRIQSFLEGQQFLYRLTKRLSSEDQK